MFCIKTSNFVVITQMTSSLLEPRYYHGRTIWCLNIHQPKWGVEVRLSCCFLVRRLIFFYIYIYFNNFDVKANYENHLHHVTEHFNPALKLNEVIFQNIFLFWNILKKNTGQSERRKRTNNTQETNTINEDLRWA